MKQLIFLILFIGISQIGFSQTEWKSETIYGTLKGMHFTATIDYKVDCDYSTPFVRATLKDMEVYKFEFEGETYQYDLNLPIKADDGFLVIDGEISLVKGGDFNGTFELNEKHLSLKIGGQGNAMTADEFRFTNESELTQTLDIKSCTEALEKLKYTTAILEITTKDLGKYDGDLRLNGQAINDLLIQQIKEENNSSSNSTSESQKSYLETAKEEKNEYMKQLDQEEKMRQNRDAQNERELNQIRRSNQDPTIKSIELAEQQLNSAFDNYYQQIDQERQATWKKIEDDLAEEKEQNRRDQEYYERTVRAQNAFRRYEDVTTDMVKYMNEMSLDKSEVENKRIILAYCILYRNYKDSKSYFNDRTDDYPANKIPRLEIHTFAPTELTKDNLKFNSIEKTIKQFLIASKIIDKKDFYFNGYINEYISESYIMMFSEEGNIIEKLKDKSSSLALKNNIVVHQSDIDLKDYLDAMTEKELTRARERYKREQDEKKRQFAARAIELEKVEELKIELLSDYDRFKSEIELYSNLRKLTFDIEKRQLEKLPQNIGSLKKLEELRIWHGKFNSIPESIGKLKNLKSLDIFEYKGETLPNSIGELSSLTKLELTYCKLSSLPESIGNLKSLDTLIVDAVTSYKVPPKIKLPESIGQLNNLKVLEINKLELINIPSSISNLQQLQILTLTNGNLKQIPAEIMELENLRVLNLGGNDIAKIPIELDNLLNLEVLDLGGNSLTELSNSIETLTNLKHLYLGHNNIEELPTSIGNLTTLNTLDLSKNYFEKLPSSIGNLKNLEELDLRPKFRQKTTIKELPKTMSGLTSLKRIYLDKTLKKYKKYLPKKETLEVQWIEW